eukprot:TRINITY_DN2913_c0_g1_i2.p1 TRINITY_DN2913_c0_g1~~TRINITY_DN2913_c0_g1_i2.p1  ORF type:complete len:1198 (+),score=356.36 TRINITY_DN2913_c0_g1_i2:335-3928(+)
MSGEEMRYSRMEDIPEQLSVSSTVLKRRRGSLPDSLTVATPQGNATGSGAGSRKAATLSSRRHHRVPPSVWSGSGGARSPREAGSARLGIVSRALLVVSVIVTLVAPHALADQEWMERIETDIPCEAPPPLDPPQQKCAARRKQLDDTLVGSIAVSPTGDLIATGLDILSVWNLTSGRSLEIPFQGEGEITFSRDGSRLAVRSHGASNITFFDTRNFRRAGSFVVASETVGMAYLEDSRIVTYSLNARVTFWSESGKFLSDVEVPDNAGQYFAITPDGQWVAVGGENGATIVSVATGYSRRLLAMNTFELRFSPNPEILAVGAYNGSLILLHWRSGRILHEVNYDPHTVGKSLIYGLRFSPNGYLVAGILPDWTALIISVASGEILFTIEMSLWADFVNDSFVVTCLMQCTLWELPVNRVNISAPRIPDYAVPLEPEMGNTRPAGVSSLMGSLRTPEGLALFMGCVVTACVLLTALAWGVAKCRGGQSAAADLQDHCGHPAGSEGSQMDLVEFRGRDVLEAHAFDSLPDEEVANPEASPASAKSRGPSGPSTTSSFFTVRTMQTSGGSGGEVGIPSGKHVEGPADPCYATWQQVKELGRGGFSVVHCGRLSDGRLVAMKHQECADRTEADEAFATVKLLHRLRHPHLIEMYDVIYDPPASRLCVFMEYVPGGSLGSMVRKLGRPLDESVAAFFIHQVLQGLMFLHNSMMAHRDIKGDNILLMHSEGGTVKLCDFGTLKDLSGGGGSERVRPSAQHLAASDPAYLQTCGSTFENTTVGSPNWMAPEVIQSGNRLCPAGTPADIYSVGCTVSEVLNQGSPPGPTDQSANRWAILMAMMRSPEKGRENIVEGVSDSALDFIHSCMRLDPEERPTAAQLLQHPFISQWADATVTATLKMPVVEKPAQTQLREEQMQGATRMEPPLGRGSFGVVYLAVLNDGSGRHVAVKELLLGASHSAEARQRVEMEFTLMQSLQHTHIVQYLGHTWKSASALNIFMEYMPGGSVRSLLYARGCALPQMTARVYTRQVLLGLEYLHRGEAGRAAVAHRDLKADNLLLSHEGDVKISDFGCSKLFEGDGGHSAYGAQTCVGTPFWMAPEVLRKREGSAAYGTRCDIWSLGCTVIEMLGHTPWQREGGSEGDHEILGRILGSREGPPIPAGTPSDLEEFALSCFAYEPCDRPSAADLLASPVMAEVILDKVQ